MGRSIASDGDPKGCRGASGKYPVRPQAQTPAFGGGLTRRLRREGRACSPMGRAIALGGDPKGCRGERREARAQWAQPPQAVSDPEFRQTTSGAHGSAGRVDCLPRGKPPACSDNGQLCRKQIPLAGTDAPTPARAGTGRPKGRSHFSFGGERKVCKRKPAARRLQSRPAPLRVAGFVLR